MPDTRNQQEKFNQYENHGIHSETNKQNSANMKIVESTLKIRSEPDEHK